jgi:hypothetical protein
MNGEKHKCDWLSKTSLMTYFSILRKCTILVENVKENEFPKAMTEDACKSYISLKRHGDGRFRNYCNSVFFLV